MPESSKPRTAALARRLSILYLAALGTIALLTIIGQFVVQQAIIQLEGDSRIVNIAGRQRMLSQRMTRLMFDLAYTKQADTANKIRMDLDTWTLNHVGLQRGSTVLQLPGKNSQSVEKRFNELTPHFEVLREIIESTLVRFSPGGDSVLNADIRNELSFHSDAFLAGMDNIVASLEKEARDRVNRLRWIETALLFATIAVLVCEGLFVFSPAVASLNRSLTQLQRTSDELERAKEVAENANRAKTIFLAKVSHELRTPLHSILGMLALVRQSNIGPNQLTQIRLAHEASTSLLSLVDDLLDVASIEQGREFIIHPQVVDLPGLLASTSEVMSPLAVAKGLQYELKLDKLMPTWVTLDADRVRQVMSNLLQNAIRYTTTGSVQCKADIQTEETQVLLRLAIEDTGIGISPTDQERIFTSFTRGGRQEAPSEFGRRMGLGLTITKAIVKRLGGEISLTSEVGKGSRFTVTLPFQVAKANDSNQAILPIRTLQFNTALTSSNHARPTALIVDDSPTNLLVMRLYLRQLGYRTMSVSSLKASIVKFRTHRFDIVLMDRNLADGDGLDFPRLLSDSDATRCFGSSRVFLVTAEINLTADSDLRLKPFTRVLHKPISLAELQASIDANVPHEVAPCPRTQGEFDFEGLKRKLTRIVIERLPDELESFKRLLEQSDFTRLEFISHRLLGSAGNAGMSALATLATKLNHAAAQRDSSKIESIISQLDKLVASIDIAHSRQE